MSGITLTIKIHDKAVRRLFAKLERRTGNLRPVMKSIGQYMERRTFERFGREQDPWGRPWVPLSLETLKQKKAGLKILQGETSLLRDEINSRPGKDSVEIGTPSIYGAIHQLGGLAGKGLKVSIPARPYLGVNDEDEQEFENILTDYLMDL